MHLFGDLPGLLLALRKRKGLSRELAASTAGVSARALSKYEKGESVPGVAAFEKVLAAYGVEDLAQLQVALDEMGQRGAYPEANAVPPSKLAESRELGQLSRDELVGIIRRLLESER